MARAGMATLIEMLRGLTNAGIDDTTVAGVTYWSDDQLQAALDRTQKAAYELPLVPLAQRVSGGWTCTTYAVPDGVGPHFEQAGTLSGWAVRDLTGAEIGTVDYTVNYEAGRIEFDVDQAGAERYLDCRWYDVNRAAAYVWDAKAGFVANRVRFATSTGQSADAGDEYEHCLRMAERFRLLAGPSQSAFVRVDET